MDHFHACRFTPCRGSNYRSNAMASLATNQLSSAIISKSNTRYSLVLTSHHIKHTIAHGNSPAYVHTADSAMPISTSDSECNIDSFWGVWRHLLFGKLTSTTTTSWLILLLPMIHGDHFQEITNIACWWVRSDILLFPNWNVKLSAKKKTTISETVIQQYLLFSNIYNSLHKSCSWSAVVTSCDSLAVANDQGTDSDNLMVSN